MKIWSTPTLTFDLEGDVSDADIIFTFKQGMNTINLRPDNIYYSEKNLATRCEITFSQEDSSVFDPTRTTYVMANCLWPSGARVPTETVTMHIGNNFLDREVNYGD